MAHSQQRKQAPEDADKGAVLAAVRQSNPVPDAVPQSGLVLAAVRQSGPALEAARGDGPALDAVRQRSPARKVDRARASQILRFRTTERAVHWAIAIPFLVCLTTAAAMVALHGRFDHPVLRSTISWVHRVSGLCLIVLPFAAVLRSRGDMRIHIYNVRQAWIWTLSDVKWLAVAGAAAINKKIALPDQGKFNAAEKLNFMVLMGTYPFYIATGLTIWLTHNAFLSWVVHVAVALMGAPLIIGHIYMATINPSSRVGLQGMITGFVDRHWAKHHYRRWVLEQFEEEVEAAVDETTDGAVDETMVAAVDETTEAPAVDETTDGAVDETTDAPADAKSIPAAAAGPGAEKPNVPA